MPGKCGCRVFCVNIWRCCCEQCYEPESENPQHRQAENIPAQVILQNYMFERLLVRLAASAYKDKFVLKGGMLVAAIVGLDNRVILNAHFDTLITPLSIDVSTGDAITPHAVQYRFLIRLCLPKHCAPPPITAASPIRLQMCLPFFTISRAVGNSKSCGNTSFLVWFGR